MGGGEIIISDFPFLYGGGGGVLIISGSDHSTGQSGTTVRPRPEPGSEQCIGAIIKLGGAGNRFGDCLCVDCFNLPCAVQVDAINLQTQNSPDLLPEFRSLDIMKPMTERTRSSFDRWLVNFVVHMHSIHSLDPEMERKCCSLCDSLLLRRPYLCGGAAVVATNLPQAMSDIRARLLYICQILSIRWRGSKSGRAQKVELGRRIACFYFVDLPR